MMPIVVLTSRAALVLVFTMAAWSKLAKGGRFAAFTASLEQMDLLPRRLVRPTAVVLAGTEVGVAVLLVVPGEHTGAAGFLLATVLLASFTAAIGLSIKRNNRSPCACFGRTSTPLGRIHLVRNSWLLAVACIGFVTIRASGDKPPLAGFIIALALGCVLGLFAVMAEDLAGLFRAEASY